MSFTATPKAETKTLFGRPGDREDPKNGQPFPESFHLYPMRQAIEESYIIDVLLGYMPHRTAYRLKEDIVPDKVVDERTAVRTIARWLSLHPTNVMSKAEFIVEHFVKNVAQFRIPVRNAGSKCKNCNRRKAAAADAETNGRPAVVTVG